MADRAYITTVSTTEANASLRTTTYDLYVDGKYVTTYHDVLKAVEARDEINVDSRGQLCECGQYTKEQCLRVPCDD